MVFISCSIYCSAVISFPSFEVFLKAFSIWTVFLLELWSPWTLSLLVELYTYIILSYFPLRDFISLSKFSLRFLHLRYFSARSIVFSFSWASTLVNSNLRGAFSAFLLSLHWFNWLMIHVMYPLLWKIILYISIHDSHSAMFSSRNNIAFFLFSSRTLWSF